MIVEQNEVELDDGEELGSLEEVEEQEEQVEEPEEPKVPEKFRGKSLEDVVKSYQELESEFGRRNNEVGELRKLTDELLNLQLKEKEESQTQQKKSVDVDYLLENPESAINDAVANNPKLQAIEKQFQEQSRSKAKQEFEAKHDDWQDIVSSQSFQQWVGSSKFRTQLFQDAHVNYNYDAADELFSLYKDVVGVKKDELQGKVEAKRQGKLKAATVESGSTGAKSKKVFRRADLINLRITNPAKYEAMEGEIMKAYAEGRVR